MEYTCNFEYKKNKKIFDTETFIFPDNKTTVICGHNGAGKTTLLKCICGIFNTTNTVKDSWYVGSSGSLILFFSLDEHIKFIENKTLANQLINQFELDNIRKQPISNLSTGQKMLASIIVALCSDKPILLLDEPFGPLDPTNSEKLLKILKNSKKTVIISSHDLFITSEIADKVIFIKDGKITFESNELNIEANYLKEKYLELA